MKESLELLKWDSNFFGFPIGRINASKVDGPFLAQADFWAQKHNLQCTYFLCDPGHHESVVACETAGFHLMDIRVTLSWNLLKWPYQAEKAGNSGLSFRLANSADVCHLERMGQDSFSFTRFYTDQRFARSKVSELYQIWIRNDCQTSGESGSVVVAELGGEIVGYVSYHHRSPSLSQVGLVCVDSSRQKVGVGTALLAEASRRIMTTGREHFEIVTQAQNLAAMHLYEKVGFRQTQVQLWYHKWYDLSR